MRSECSAADAREAFEHDEPPLDQQQPIGQRLVVAAGKPGDDQLARDARHGARDDMRPHLQALDLARWRAAPTQAALLQAWPATLAAAQA